MSERLAVAGGTSANGIQAGVPKARVHKLVSLGTLPPGAEHWSGPEDERPQAEKDPATGPVSGVPAGTWRSRGHKPVRTFVSHMCLLH